MTSKERIESAFGHVTPDRTPYFEYVLLSPVADIILGHTYIDYNNHNDTWDKFYKENGFEASVRRFACDRLELAEKLNHDIIYVVPNPTDKIVDVASNTLFSDPVEDIIKRNIRKEEELNKPLDEKVFLVYEILLEEMKKRGMDIDILAPAYAHGVWDDVNLMQCMLLDENVAKKHFQLATANVSRCIDKYLELGIRHIGVGGDIAGSRPLISPDCYSEFILPEIKILTKKIHKSNGYAINASDGDLWSVIEDFLINSGVDGYLEIDSRAGMNLGELKMKYGEDITFLGNMDCGEVLSFYTPEDIESETISCIENGLGDGGHIFCASNAITESVPIANYLAMVNTYREYFNLDKIVL